jgi:hypothetical protein|mmetsp:Transcript_976/g.1649  ORF Transcript_976/g.1649 Transcript_976/m.1649 type:complete len:348 (-) Transcript_976:1629-2672(-)
MLGERAPFFWLVVTLLSGIVAELDVDDYGNAETSKVSIVESEHEFENLVKTEFKPQNTSPVKHPNPLASPDLFMTFFTSVKPITASSNITQWNALMSWRKQKEVPEPKVYVLGKTKDAEVLTGQTRSAYIPEVGSMGRPPIPILRFMFEKIKWAEPYSKFYVFCTSDIIFPPEFGATLQFIKKDYPEFLAVGQRTTLPVRHRIHFDNESWFEPLRTKAKGHHLDNPWAIDYFAYTQNLYGDLGLLPQLLIGRTYVDNWLLHYARKLNQPVVDLTDSIPVIHQKHDHSFMKGGTPWHSHEAKYNKLTVKRYGGIGNGNIARTPLVLICKATCKVVNRSSIATKKKSRR